MNPWADYQMVLERQRELEEAAARPYAESRVVAVVAALAGRLGLGRG